MKRTESKYTIMHKYTVSINGPWLTGQIVRVQLYIPSQVTAAITLTGATYSEEDNSHASSKMTG